MQALQNDVGAAAPRLLVIDDDKVQQIVMGKVGGKAGYLVTIAGSVEEAIKEIEKQNFECIILDLLLNGQNGILVLGEIAAHSSETLLIVISGASGAVREQTLRLATHYKLDAVELPKPVDLAALRTLLKSGFDVVQPTCP
jgi:DNA-binding NtrC family response regulator